MGSYKGHVYEFDPLKMTPQQAAVEMAKVQDAKAKSTIQEALRGPEPPPPDPKLGIGGAPTRNTTLPTDPAERKKYPMATGLLDYFPDALAEVSHISWRGNEQHNPGQPLHWARGKSRDEDDTTIRHFVQRGTRDVDGQRHTAKAAWRILATLQKEIEDERATTTPRSRPVNNYPDDNISF